MTAPNVALATCLEWPGLSESDGLYASALAGRGVSVASAPWNGPVEPFERAELVVLRSTWDYHRAADAFLAWLRTLHEAGTPISNAPSLVAWNLDKSYLLDLKRRGVRVPESAVVPNRANDVAGVLIAMNRDEAVVKPVTGASGHLVQRVHRDALDAEIESLAGVPDRLLVQEFVPEVQESGELSCVFFDGRFSHAVVKRPAPGEYRVNSQYQGRVEPAEPAAGVVRQAAEILTLLPELPLYARVDGVLRDGVFLLMELELIEPSLYLQHAPGAAERFAEATLRRLHSARGMPAGQ